MTRRDDGSFDPDLDLDGFGLAPGASWRATASMDEALQRQLVRSALFTELGGPVVGRFIVEDRLGAGATAVVYAARDPALDRRVAIKLLACRDGWGAWTDRMQREGRALARLAHRNVVSVYEIGDWNGHPFIAMELIDGTTLARWQAAAARRPDEILAAYVEAGRGLQAAHEIGLVHRDFKPANVLVSTAGRIVVSDFGLVGDAPVAGQGDDLGARATAAVGTPAYLAPEQARGEAPDPRADVFSFSVALCEALLGRHPVLDPGPPWPRALARRVPRRVCAALARGMAAEPAARWPSMAAMLAELAPRWPRWRRRAVVVAGPAIALAIAAVVVTGGSSAARGPGAPSSAPAGGALVAAAGELLDRDPTTAAALLAEVGPAERDAGWAAAARSALLRPIARAVRCTLPASTPLEVPFVDGSVLATRDRDGRVVACDAATGAVTTVAEGVRCLRGVDRALLVTLTTDGTLETHERAGMGWRRVVQVPAVAGAVSPAEAQQIEACGFDVVRLAPDQLEVRLRGGRRLWAGPGVAPPDASTVGLRAASPDGQRWLVAVRDGDGDGDGDGLTVIDRAADGAVLRSRPIAGAVRHVRVDPGLRVAAILLADRVDVVELAGGAVIASTALAGIDPRRVRLEVGRDGRHVVVATQDGELRRWTAGAGWRASSVLGEGYLGMRLSPSGRWLAVVDSWGRVEVHDGVSQQVFQLTSPRRLDVADFVDDDQVVAVDRTGELVSWALPAVPGRVVAVHAGRVWTVATDESGTVVASGGKDGTVQLASLDGGPARVLALGADVRVYALRFDGERLLAACNDGSVQIWRWRDGVRLASLPGHEVWAFDVDIARAAGQPDVVVTGSKGGVVRLWVDGAAGPAAELRDAAGLDGRINDVAAAPGGGRIAAVSASGRLVLADAPGGELRATIAAHKGWARRVAFDTPDSVVTVGDDGALRRWSALDGAPLGSVTASSGHLLDLELRAGQALTAAEDGLVQLWDVAAGRLLRSFRGHTARVRAVRWRADGAWLLSGDDDGRTCLWRSDREGCQAWLPGGGGAIMAAAFAAGGRVVTGAEDGLVRVWAPAYEGSDDELAEALQRRAPACLDEEQRRRYFGEVPQVAAARARACRAAPPPGLRGR